MTQQKKHRFWIAAIIVLVATVALFSSKPDSVTAMFSDTHICDVLLRVRNEIMQKCPAGQYYEALFWKHSSEFNQIFNNHPEHVDWETLRVIRMFIPGLEALLDGKGDTVRITKEQVNSLKAELDWISSFASPSLREDIEKEEQHYPLENFVGMTMSEALDYINSNFPSNLMPESIVPTAVVTETPEPFPTPTCIRGFGSDCLAEPLLLPDSNGLWAYYVLNGVYFEYPSTWHITQLADQQNLLHILPTMNSEAWNILLQRSAPIIIQRPFPIWNHPVSTGFVWKRPVFMADFEGVEFLWKDQNAPKLTHLEVFLYGENDQIAVDLLAFVIDTPQIAGTIDDPNAVNENFPNFQRIIESFRIWKP
jgi:hypothetical protein